MEGIKKKKKGAKDNNLTVSDLKRFFKDATVESDVQTVKRLRK